MRFAFTPRRLLTRTIWYGRACQWLYTRRIVIPGPRRLKDWARDALATIEASVLAHVSAAVPVARARRHAYCIRPETNSTHLSG